MGYLWTAPYKQDLYMMSILFMLKQYSTLTYRKRVKTHKFIFVRAINRLLKYVLRNQIKYATLIISSPLRNLKEHYHPIFVLK